MKGWVLKLAAKFTDEADADKLLERITTLRLLSMEKSDRSSKTDFLNLKKQVRQDQFEDLMHFRDKDDDIQIMIKEGRERVTDILVLIEVDEEFTLISLEGNLKFSDIQQLQFDIEGTEHLERVPERRSGAHRVPGA